jgi:hypothetical protein
MVAGQEAAVRAKDCAGVVAHQLTDKTSELKRTDQMVTMTLENDHGDVPEEPEPSDIHRGDRWQG